MDTRKETFIIAEAGVNHNGKPELALKLIDKAVEAGADAIKFQTFSADKLVSTNAGKAAYQESATGSGTQYEMLKSLELDDDAHLALIDHCRKSGIEFMSTPFDTDSADFLLAQKVDRIKIPSGEVTNHPFLQHLAAKDIPLILSTGMADLDEVSDAVEVISETRKSLGLREPLPARLTLLHCTSSYPAELPDINLRAMTTMREAIGLPVGYSDHSLGIFVCIAAVALGACVLEKHFTLDRTMDGPDHSASLEPAELAELVKQVRNTEIALGSSEKKPTQSEEEMRIVARRSVAASGDIAKGAVLTRQHLTVLRPATGIQPRELENLLGRVAEKEIKKGQPLQWSDLVPVPDENA